MHTQIEHSWPHQPLLSLVKLSQSSIRILLQTGAVTLLAKKSAILAGVFIVLMSLLFLTTNVVYATAVQAIKSVGYTYGGC